MPCKTRKSLPSNGVVLPSNEAITTALIVRFNDFIIGTSYKMGVRYRFTSEDREDLKQHVYVRLARADWRAIFRNKQDYERVPTKETGGDSNWLKKNVNHPSRNWTVEEVAFVLKNYAKIVIRNAFLEATRQLKCNGLAGLGLHKLNELPIHDEFGFDQYRENVESDYETDEPGADGQADRTAASQVAAIAKEMLEPLEWQCLSLQFGFDGGGTRTPTQVAREAHLPRKRTQELLDAALAKLRVRVEGGSK